MPTVKNPRIMVDMSATLIHHGHIRLLKHASSLGTVVVGLTTDNEIVKKKGYTPEMNYYEREEVLLAIRYVDTVVPSPWLLDQPFLDKHNIDYLLHGHDNSNDVDKERTIILPRTDGISSSDLRLRAASNIAKFRKHRGNCID
jgi:cytidyltransferase-like protein